MGCLIRALPFLLLPNIGPAAAADTADSYVDSLVERAAAEGLSRDPYWRTLLHYKGGIFGVKSLIDDRRFFLSPGGNDDPEEEMEATIRGFFTPLEEGVRHPVCRFAARFAWLKERLDIDESRLPVPRCDAYDTLIDQIAPESITLIFPTSHMNSPASMYGHTLLTIRGGDGSDLLSYAVNYAAVTDETFGPLYIVKGLFGLYSGFFSILPYYAKLQEYSDVNDRDIWEYPIDLSPEEIDRLMRHIYELQDISSDYYFFSENCSYDLLFLLDAARPGLDLTDRCGWWVIPLDTVRLIRRSGLASKAVFRPSKSTKIRHLASLLSHREKKLARSVALGEKEVSAITGVLEPTEVKAVIADLAGEYLQYRYAKKEMPKEEYAGRFLAVLKARSELGGADSERTPIRPPPRPDAGHKSNRISIGHGFAEDRPFEEIRLRPAYHSLVDNSAGYKEGSQIVFLDMALRYRTIEKKLEIERVDLIDIISLAPRDLFFQQTSWKVSTGFLHRTMKDGKRRMVYRLNSGFGYAWKTRFTGIWYFMVESDLNVGAVLDHGYSFGGGGSSGMLRSIGRRWRLHVYARDVYHGAGDTDNLFTAVLEQNFEISANTSVAVELKTSGERDRWEQEGTLRWNTFF